MILGGLSIIGGIHLARSVFGGIWSASGEWSEFRLWSIFVVDVYNVWFGALM